jgi:hypothetical protein
MLDAIEHDRAPYKKAYGRKKPFWFWFDGRFNGFFNSLQIVSILK